MTLGTHSAKKIIGSIVLALPTLLLFINGFGKISGASQETILFQSLGIDQYRVALGVVEILLTVLLWIPKTHRFAILAASSVLGGAVAVELMLGMSGLIAGGALFLVWVGSYLRSSWCSCHACRHGGAHCADCKNGVCSIHGEKCNCKPGCDCIKGVCTC